VCVCVCVCVVCVCVCVCGVCVCVVCVCVVCVCVCVCGVCVWGGDVVRIVIQVSLANIPSRVAKLGPEMYVCHLILFTEVYTVRCY